MRRIVALVLLATFVVGGSHAAPPRPTSTSTPTPDEVMTIFGFSKKQRRALHAGEVVTMDLKRIGNEVVALVALRMPPL